MDKKWKINVSENLMMFDSCQLFAGNVDLYARMTAEGSICLSSFKL